MSTATNSTRPQPDWHLRATCAKHFPELWFPEGRGDHCNEAKRICEKCPVRRDCGLDANDRGEEFGMKAGFLLDRASGRKALRKWLGLPTGRAEAAEGELLCNRCGDPFKSDGAKKRCSGCAALVDATETRTHIQCLLDADRTLADIGRDSGVHAETVRVIMYGNRTKPPTKKITRTNATKILAVPVPAGVAR